MQKWEYQTLTVWYNEETYLAEVTSVNNERVGKLIEKGKGLLGIDKYAYPDLHSYLTTVGQEGWEVVDTLTVSGVTSARDRTLVILKRPI